MKIKEEYTIKLKGGALDIYRMNKISKEIKINKIKYKKESRFVELICEFPKNNISLVKSKSMNTNNIFSVESLGYQSKANYYNISFNKDLKEAYITKIDTFFLFNSKFAHLETLTNSSDLGLQFRRVESREEIEHRKRNINYKIKVLENESFKELSFSINKLNLDEDSEAKIQKADPFIHKVLDLNRSSNSSLDLRIQKSIKIARIVNVKDLQILYKDINLIRSNLSKMTFYFKGRYILNNSYYDRELHEIRNKIFKLLKEKEYILNSDVSGFINDNFFLIEELCNKKLNKFYLKGFYEEEDNYIVSYDEHTENEIYKLLMENIVCSLSTIRDVTKIETECIHKALNSSDVKSIGDGLYCILDDHNSIKNEMIKLIEKSKIYKKNELNKIAQQICSENNISLESFFSTFEKLFVLKRNVWYFKESYQ